MPGLSWDAFARLPGSADWNFEHLCRALVRLHHGAAGDFLALANQPGVEFHLRLRQDCTLGAAGRWYGWQCRWYDLPSGRALGATRRAKIVEALETTTAVLPHMTDWVLWTRHPLTAADQTWFQGLATSMTLHQWTAAEVDALLSGPATMLRATYFGELVLTPGELARQHGLAVDPVRRRWQPEVHQIVGTEAAIRRGLGEAVHWAPLTGLAERLITDVGALAADAADLTGDLAAAASALAAWGHVLARRLRAAAEGLEAGDLDVLRQSLAATPASAESGVGTIARRLRAARHPAALTAANALASCADVAPLLAELDADLGAGLVAVTADAGFGKTELTIALTEPGADRPAGLLLHGRDLRGGGTLDDLASRVVLHGAPVASFEALIGVVDAAGRRARRRLPLVIDGLNEAEDPRDWQSALAPAARLAARYPYVLVLCTLRAAFVGEALPADTRQLELPGFGPHTEDAVARYFGFYRITVGDADPPAELLSHPLTLRLYCEVTNPTRERTVSVESGPGSLSALFERYLGQASERIAQLAPRTQRYYAGDVQEALDRIGEALWRERARSLEVRALRTLLDDAARPWDASLVRALEHDGVLLRVPGEDGRGGRVAVVYDALAGHIVAAALLAANSCTALGTWAADPVTATALDEGTPGGHPLAGDIFRALAAQLPRRHHVQLWPMLAGPLRARALAEAAGLEGR